MNSSLSDRSFVTDGRIQIATHYADDLAVRKPWFTASECAGEAVRKIFGRWILDHAAAIRPEFLPLYFQLVNAVEGRLGLHRRLDSPFIPASPAVIQHQSVCSQKSGVTRQAAQAAV